MVYRILITGVALAALGTAAYGADAAADPGLDIVVTGLRLNTAREAIKPSLGASTYSLSNANIVNIPGGDSQPLNDIILQLPGISQDQFGQFHVRDDHNGLEYRLNGVILPEGISVFGQSLSPRLIEKLDLITGALPAQYGLRSAGIIDITTKSGLKNAANIGIYGGSHGTIEPSFDVQGSSGGTGYFISGNYIRNDLGVENVNTNDTALHDTSRQYNVFGYIDHIISANDRLSLTFGYSNQHYQIPNPIGLQPLTGYAVSGVTMFPSERLNETQLQSTGFGILSLLHTKDNFTLQASVFGRTSALDYHPDIVGELLFNGLAQVARKRDAAFGTQIEAVYKLTGHHTLRGGVILQDDHSTSRTQTTVFPTALSGSVTAGAAPIMVNDSGGSTQITSTAYLQDEWALAPHLVLNYGLRFDENDGLRNERQVSPRINFVYTPNKALTIHGGYARYFSPAPFELVASTTVTLFNGTTGASQVGRDDTPSAERENYFDVGFQQKFGRDFTIGLDGYYRLSTNLVDEGQFGAPIILSPFNYAKGRVRGMEFTANYAHGGLSAYANLAYAKAQGTNITSSQFNFAQPRLDYIAANYIYLDHDQTWTGSAGVSYQFRHGKLEGSRLSADLIYGSGLRRSLALTDANGNQQMIPNGAALPHYLTANVSAGHKFTRLGLDIRIDIVNVFDHIYEIRDGTGVGVGAPSFGARRGVFAGITKSF